MFAHIHCLIQNQNLIITKSNLIITTLLINYYMECNMLLMWVQYLCLNVKPLVLMSIMLQFFLIFITLFLFNDQFYRVHKIMNNINDNIYN